MVNYYTRSGDNGSSSLGNKKVPKNSYFFKLSAEIDSFRSSLNILISKLKRYEKKSSKNKDLYLFLINELDFIRNLTFSIGAISYFLEINEINSNMPKFDSGNTKHLEDIIDNLKDEFPAPKSFVVFDLLLPAELDKLRTESRKLEIIFYEFLNSLGINDNLPDDVKEIQRFLNRLSSYLFVLSLYTNYKLGGQTKGPTYKRI